MKTRDQLIKNYDELAAKYAERFCDELKHKPFDRDVLRRFTESVAGGVVADVGCGPGHVTAHLASLGVKAIGVDLSPVMIEEAERRFPSSEFRVGDMLTLEMEAGFLDGVVALYSIIHLKREQLEQAFLEMNRVVRPGGQLLVSFHEGTGEFHADDVLDTKVSFDCTLFEVREVVDALAKTGFSLVETTVRRPYAVEHPTQRVYIVAEKSRGNEC